MAMLRIRSLDDDLKRRLRVRAARSGRSMEEEVRCILRDVLADQNDQGGMGSRIHAQVMALAGGVDLALPQRSKPRPPPDLVEVAR
jgi:plasmid stability protein